jgi:uncharacterized small protein (DUF1192 family)
LEEDDVLSPAAYAEAAGIPRNLEGLSVEVLKRYRQALEQEIIRVDSAMNDRHGAREGAEALFKF